MPRMPRMTGHVTYYYRKNGQGPSPVVDAAGSDGNGMTTAQK